MAPSKTMSHLFEETAYLSIGDPYVGSDIKRKKDPSDDPKKWERHKGKQFVVNALDKAKPVKNFKSLYEKEKYYDPGYYERADAKKKKERIVAGSFKPSSPPKQNSGMGNYYGTIGTRYEHKPEYNVVQRGKSPKKNDPQPKNISTRPPKRGGYGFTNLGLSEDYKRGNLVDDYEAARKIRKKELEEHKKKCKGGAFKAGCSKHNQFFDPNPFGITKLAKETKKKSYEVKKKIPVPFRPSSPAKKFDLSSYPKYMPDPYVKPKPKKKDDPKAVWKNSGCGCHSGPTRSILFGS